MYSIANLSQCFDELNKGIAEIPQVSKYMVITLKNRDLREGGAGGGSFGTHFSPQRKIPTHAATGQ